MEIKPYGFVFAALVTSSISHASTIAAPPDVDRIFTSLSGRGTPAERMHVAELLDFMIKMSQQPQRLTLANVVAIKGVSFNPPSCMTVRGNVARCDYQDTSVDIADGRLNHLNTYTLKKESDVGAQITLEINPAVVCLPNSLFAEVWSVPPIKEPPIIPDFFGGADDIEEPEALHPSAREFYQSIVPSASYINARVTSVNACVVSLDLSALPPARE